MVQNLWVNCSVGKAAKWMRDFAQKNNLFIARNMSKTKPMDDAIALQEHKLCTTEQEMNNNGGI